MLATAPTIANQSIWLTLEPSELSVEIHANPQVISPSHLGLLWHTPAPKEPITVTITNGTAVDRHVRLSVVSDSPRWRNEWVVWRAPLQSGRQLQGGDSVLAQDQTDRDDSVTLFVRAGTTRRAQLGFHVLADGVLQAGNLRFDVRAEVRESGDSTIYAAGLLSLIRPQTTLLDQLPAIYREAMFGLRALQSAEAEPPFFERYLLGFEDVLTPLRETLNSLDQLFGPFSTPSHYLLWIAAWVMLPVDENWPEMKQRKLVSEAVELFRWRGTKRGLSRFIEIYTGHTPEIEDRPIRGMRLGPLAQLRTTGAILGDIAPHTFLVTIAVPNPDSVNEELVRDIIDYCKPAHTAYALRIVERTSPKAEKTYAD